MDTYLAQVCTARLEEVSLGVLCGTVLQGPKLSAGSTYR